jgi:hypothetical protein
VAPFSQQEKSGKKVGNSREKFPWQPTTLMISICSCVQKNISENRSYPCCLGSRPPRWASSPSGQFGREFGNRQSPEKEARKEREIQALNDNLNNYTGRLPVIKNIFRKNHL